MCGDWDEYFFSFLPYYRLNYYFTNCEILWNNQSWKLLLEGDLVFFFVWYAEQQNNLFLIDINSHAKHETHQKKNKARDIKKWGGVVEDLVQ